MTAICDRSWILAVPRYWYMPKDVAPSVSRRSRLCKWEMYSESISPYMTLTVIDYMSLGKVRHRKARQA